MTAGHSSRLSLDIYIILLRADCGRPGQLHFINSAGRVLTSPSSPFTPNSAQPLRFRRSPGHDTHATHWEEKNLIHWGPSMRRDEYPYAIHLQCVKLELPNIQYLAKMVLCYVKLCFLLLSAALRLLCLFLRPPGTQESARLVLT